MKSKLRLIILGIAIVITKFSVALATESSMPSSTQLAFWDGLAQEKVSSDINYTLLNLDRAFFEEDQNSELVKTIKCANADIVCIQNVANNINAYALHKALRKYYAHFIYLPSTSDSNGLIVASKYSIENIHFNQFEENVSEGFFDFVIQNQQGPIGHIYVTPLQREALEEASNAKFQKIMRKLQDDFLKVKKTVEPFIFSSDMIISMQPNFNTNSHVVPEVVILDPLNISFFSYFLSSDETIHLFSFSNPDRLGLITAMKKKDGELSLALLRKCSLKAA